MKNKIIQPEGQELLNYINDGYIICNLCGTIMDRVNSTTGNDNYVCPACGLKVDTLEYKYEYDGENHDDIEYSKIFGDSEGEIPPVGCSACGGPYPYCKTSCKLFDD